VKHVLRLPFSLLESGISFLSVKLSESSFLDLFSKKKCPSCRVLLSSSRDLERDTRFEMLVAVLHPDLASYRAKYVRVQTSLNLSFLHLIDFLCFQRLLHQAC
jgi:hypothetical protein